MVFGRHPFDDVVIWLSVLSTSQDMFRHDSGSDTASAGEFQSSHPIRTDDSVAKMAGFRLT